MKRFVGAAKSSIVTWKKTTVLRVGLDVYGDFFGFVWCFCPERFELLLFSHLRFAVFFYVASTCTLKHKAPTKKKKTNSTSPFNKEPIFVGHDRIKQRYFFWQFCHGESLLSRSAWHGGSSFPWWKVKDQTKTAGKTVSRGVENGFKLKWCHWSLFLLGARFAAGQFLCTQNNSAFRPQDPENAWGPSHRACDGQAGSCQWHSQGVVGQFRVSSKKCCQIDKVFWRPGEIKSFGVPDFFWIWRETNELPELPETTLAMTCTKKSFLKQGSLNYPFGEDQTSSKCIVMLRDFPSKQGIVWVGDIWFSPLSNRGPARNPCLPSMMKNRECRSTKLGFFTGKKTGPKTGMFGMWLFGWSRNPKKNITSQESHQWFSWFFLKKSGENIVRELSECPAQVPKQALLGAQAGVNTWSSFCFVWSRGGGNGIENKNRRGLISFLAHICLKGCCTFSSFRLHNGFILGKGRCGSNDQTRNQIHLFIESISKQFVCNKHKRPEWMFSKGK